MEHVTDALWTRLLVPVVVSTSSETTTQSQMATAFDLQEELQALQDISSYSIEREHDIRSMEPGEMDGLLQRV